MKISNPYHLEIIDQLQKVSGKPPQNGLYMLHYCGSNKPGYDLNTAGHAKIIKDFVEKHDLSPKESVDFINSLFRYGQSYNEIILGGSFVGRILKNDFDPNLLDFWLNRVHGWAETDVLCQSNFTADILLSRWSDWQKVLQRFVSDSNVHKRRASLVLLTKPLRLSPDPRLLKIAISHVEKLKPEKDILITKAVSWVLRSMVVHHGDFLADYLKKNQNSLPKIAYREAYTKLTTGRKYNRPVKDYSTKVKA